MKNNLLSLFFLLTFLLPGQAQINRDGYPFIRYFKPSEMKAADQNWSAVRDKRGVIYIANMDNGVLEYDGITWRAHPLPGNVNTHVVFVDSRGILYAGGDREFGYFQPDNSGNLVFHSLVEKLDSAGRQFTKIYTINEWKDNIVFASTKQFFFYDPVKDIIKHKSLADDGFVNGNYSFVVGGQYFHGEYSQGLLEYDGEHFRKVKNASAFSLKSILAILPYDDDQVLVVTHRSGAFGYNLKTGAVDPDIFSKEANDFLKKRFYKGTILPDGSYALGTLAAGMAIVSHDGNILQILDEKTALGSIPVTNVYYDKDAPVSSQLWVPLNIGIARVEWFSPFRYFNEDYGFKGSVNDLIYFNGKLFVATSNGVFYRTADESGLAVFNQVAGVTAQAWSFLSFTPPGAKSSHLWIGTEEGIYDITDLNRVKLVEEGIPNLVPKGRKFYIYKLFASKQYPYKVFIGTNKNIIILEYRAGKWYVKLSVNDLNGEEIRSIVSDDEANIWFSTNYTGLVKLGLLEDNKYQLDIYGAKQGLEKNSGNLVFFLDHKLYGGNTEGLFVYKPDKDVFVRDTLFRLSGDNEHVGIYRFKKIGDNRYLFNIQKPDGTVHVVMIVRDGEKLNPVTIPFKRLPLRSADAFCQEKNLIWIGISNQLFSYNTSAVTDFNTGFKTLIRKVVTGEDSIIFGGAFPEVSDISLTPASDIQPLTANPDLKYTSNNLTFHWSSPYFIEEEGITYSYRLRGFDDNWSNWSQRHEFPFTNIPNGDFVFEVKARNIFGVESSTGSFTFGVLPPWYLTIWAFILYVILAFLLIVLIVKLYTRRLQNEKIRLEGIVAERTAEVVRQKEELTDSIMYASRIQKAVLPAERLLNEQFPEHFILFKPRDIVSGDFYWMTQRKNKIFVSAADCTGHGVPGAFMSLLGISFLNEIVNKSEINQPGKILDELRNHVMTSLKQRGEEGETKDGMDMAICVIDRDNMTLQFAGAYNPMYYVRPLADKEKKDIAAGKDHDFPRGSIYDEKNVLIQIAADKMPIGISAKDEQHFTTHEMKLIPGHSIYMFSDGYVDQFGGENNKKFMSRAFKKLILSIQDIPMKKQREVLDERLLEWMGDNPQVDDIIVIGLKLN